MHSDEINAAQDPIAWLLAFIRDAERLAAALRDPMESAQGLTFFSAQLPAYSQDLEQALFPLLKGRLRSDEDEDDETLRRAIFIASGALHEMQELVTLLPLAVFPGVLEKFRDALDRHLENMEEVILPSVHLRLGECDIALLRRAVARHRGYAAPAAAACPAIPTDTFRPKREA